jgi:dihydrofolate reductase
MKLIHIVAMQRATYGIGKDNTLPWRVSGDIAHFKKVTRGGIVLMGRKTFESLPNGALPDRLNIVITRDPKYNPKDEKVLVFNDIYSALALLEYNFEGVGEIYIIGGAEIYAATDHMVHEKFITLVTSDAVCDTFLPSDYLKNIESYISCQYLPFEEGKDFGIVYYLKTNNTGGA